MLKNSKWLILVGVGLVAMMINMDMTVVNLALATIGKDLHATLTQMQWLVNIYMLTNIIFIIFAGKLSDIFSRKPIYLIGICFFLVGSVIAGLAPNQWILILARAIQGIGFAFTLSLGIVIVTSVFPENRRGFILGCYMTIASVSQALGPTMSGLILQYMSWRWLFLINIPLALFAILTITKFYQQESILGKKNSVNLYSVILLAMVLSVFVFSFNQLGCWGPHSWKFISLLLVGVILSYIFYRRELVAVSPLINLELFQNRNYFLINIIRFIYMYGWIGILFCIPLYLQNIMGIDPLYTGLALFCMTVMSALLSPIIGIWLDRLGFIRPVVVAVFLSLVSFVLFANLPMHLSLPMLITALLLFGISAPIMGSASAGVALSSVPTGKSGVGMGIFYTMAFLGSTLGVALAGSLLSIVSIHHMLDILRVTHYHVTAADLKKLHHIASGASSIKTLASGSHVKQLVALQPYVRSSFMAGLSTVMWINGVGALVSLGLCCILKRSIRA